MTRSARARQRSLLQRQLDLAREVNRPVIVHMREAQDAAGGPCAEDLMAILESWTPHYGRPNTHWRIDPVCCIRFPVH